MGYSPQEFLEGSICFDEYLMKNLSERKNYSIDDLEEDLESSGEGDDENTS